MKHRKFQPWEHDQVHLPERRFFCLSSVRELAEPLLREPVTQPGADQAAAWTSGCMAGGATGAGRPATAQANGFFAFHDFNFGKAGLFQQLDEFLYLSDIHSFVSCRGAGPALLSDYGSM